MEKSKWVEVLVEHPHTGIVGVHYVEVSPTLLRPEAWAANQEREKGFRVLGTRIWNAAYQQETR